MHWYYWVFLVVNVFAFVVMGADKLLARMNAKRAENKRLQRVPERTLMAFAVCFGGTGVFAAMQLFRHKTRKPLFKFGVPLALCANAATGYLLLQTLV